MFKYPVYQPELNGNEKKYVNECLDTTWISSKGKFVNEFEKEFAKYIGINHATGVSNGTVAIHLALAALGLTHGDEVIVPTFTYIASVNPVVQLGATPIFVDSDRDSWQISVEDIKRKITDRTKAIIVVHLYGHPCDMEPICKMAKERGIFVIEDCAEAIGTKYKGQHVGTFGDVSTFSFFGNKTITTGEGGMVVTNDISLFDRLTHLKGQGLAKYREYWHDVLGYNYRMTNIQAAIGLAQLEQIDKFLDKKQQIAVWYKEFLINCPVEFHKSVGDIYHSYWMCSILVGGSEERAELRQYLKDQGIETRPTFYPIHSMPMYSSRYEKHPIAEDVAYRGVNLPSYPGLKKEDIKYICNAIQEYYAK